MYSKITNKIAINIMYKQTIRFRTLYRSGEELRKKGSENIVSLGFLSSIDNMF